MPGKASEFHPNACEQTWSIDIHFGKVFTGRIELFAGFVVEIEPFELQLDIIRQIISDAHFKHASITDETKISRRRNKLLEIFAAVFVDALNIKRPIW